MTGQPSLGDIVAKEKLTEVASGSELPASTESKTTPYVVGDYYNLESVLFRCRAEVVAVHEHEIVVQPFRFDEPKMLRYHNGLSEPFMGTMIIAKATIVRASPWVPN